MSRYTSVVFDLDGTLVDSSHDIATALNRVLTPRGGRELTSQQVVPLLGEGVRRLVEEALRVSGLTPSETAIDEVVPAYLEAYRLDPVVDSILFDGVAETLLALSDSGLPLGVCTNKSEGIAHQVLNGLGIAGHFQSVVGGDRLATSKPDPTHLLATFEEMRQSSREGLYVGDSTIDQECALAARVEFRAVEWAPSEVAGQRLTPFEQLIGLTDSRPPAAMQEEHP